MSLAELWKQSPEQFNNKHVQQIIGFAGSGKLRDESLASKEFRDFLSLIPSKLLAQYADNCLSEKFEGSGLALQDIINQMGKRLGFEVTDGRYRGVSGQIGFDGLWSSNDGYAIVVEVKTTDAFRIDLDTIADYRRSLIKTEQIKNERSSVLIVVGREDTGGLEAQVRGSRHAWDIRLISIDALIRLVLLREDMEDPYISQKIRDVLIPREYTKLDGIIDIVFSTAEEVRYEEDKEEENEKDNYNPVSFNEACIKKIEKHINQVLVKRNRATFSSPDGSIVVVCKVSQEYAKSGIYYWYSFYPYQKELLSSIDKSYVAFGCGSEKHILLIPFKDFDNWMPGMNVTERGDRFYWHVTIFKEKDKFVLHRKKDYERVDLSKYIL